MKVTVLDMRRRPKKIIEALARNETVTLSMRGKEIAEIIPKKSARGSQSIKDDPAFGMWADREDLAEPSEYVHEIRKGRFHDL